MKMFLSLFSKKSVAAIVSKLHATVAELEAHAEGQHEKAMIQYSNIIEAGEKQKGHELERDLASKVASNIKSLLH